MFRKVIAFVCTMAILMGLLPAVALPAGLLNSQIMPFRWSMPVWT